MIIVVGAQKGGVGKSTLGLNMTVWRSRQPGHEKVLLIDTDAQGSGKLWVSIRTRHGIEPKISCVIGQAGTIVDAIKALQGSFDDIVIDTKGDESPELAEVLEIADKVITPLRPAMFDIATLGYMEALVRSKRTINPKLQALVLANYAPSNKGNTKVPRMRRTVAEQYKGYRMLETAIVNRSLYDLCGERGKGVMELPKGTPGFAKACEEIDQLAQEVWA